MAITQSDLITMLRNVTGRVDASDPLFTDEIMLNYLNQYTQLLSSQEVRLYKNRTWWDFVITDTTDNPYPVNLQTLGFTTIEPPAYAEGFTLFWYESPAQFYFRWPQTQTYTPTRPTDVLYYNNELTFRAPPNTAYNIRIAAYRVEYEAATTENEDYLFRFLVYGAALDVFADYGEMDKWRDIMPVFERYKSLVYARTYQQYQNQRTAPDF
jgi:hypothetical protein